MGPENNCDAPFYYDMFDATRYALINPMGKFRAAPSFEMTVGRTNGKTYLTQKLSEEDIKKAMDCSSFMIQAIGTVTRAVNEAPFVPKSIEVSADHRTVVVVWNDHEKTIVKRSENDPDDLYMAFTAALAKRIFQTNSHVKKIIQKKVNYHLPKKKGDSNE